MKELKALPRAAAPGSRPMTLYRLRCFEVTFEEGGFKRATARLHRATFWTQDTDFDGIEGVKYVARK